MGEFRMPSLGADMETGTLVEWLVMPGQPVQRGDIVALVETQKGLFEIEAFEDGIMGEPLIQAGQTVPVGTVLAMISSGTEAAARMDVQAEPTAAAESPVEGPTVPQTAAPLTDLPGRIACSPSARRLALELGVDLATVRGTGPGGAIQRSDIEEAAKAKESGAAPVVATEKPVAAAPIQPMDAATSAARMRQAIAAAVSRSNREIPHYYLETEIDLSRPLQWLAAENQKRSIQERVLPVALLLKAVAKALRDVPELNGYWLEDGLQVKAEIHIGFAVALRQGGLISPALHQVDKLSIGELMQAMADLIERTRVGRLRGSEVTDATVSVTNLGDRGVKTVYGVIYPPQVALVGFGRIAERPWAEGGMLGVRPCVTATLAADHRATDGHQGALFLEALNRHLQLPEEL